MGTIWVRELIGGLDTRKLAETTPGGVLIRAVDGHITRGGEFEKRAAFVKTYTLPDGTLGLAYTPTQLVVFGSGPAPAMPAGVAYQRLRHPDLTTPLVRVASFDLYAGRIYVAGVFADGSIHHFYDGVRVGNWYDGRARATFTLVSGVSAAAATGSLRVVSGTTGAGNELTDLKVGTVSIIGAGVVYGATAAATATAIANAINSHTSSPDYTASANGDVVTITAAAVGTAANSLTITPTTIGSFTIGNINNMSGGADASTLTAVNVAGVNTLGTPVAWQGTPAATALAVANEINSKVSIPNYVAVQSGASVTVIAEIGGAAANGRPVTFTMTGAFAITPATTSLSQGADPQDQADAVAATSIFTVTGSATGSEASAHFDIDSTSNAESITALTVGGTSIIPAPQSYPGSASGVDIAASLAGVIASYSSTSGYTATASSDRVTVRGVNRGASANGRTFGISTTGGLQLDPGGAFAGGSDGGRLYSMSIGGVQVCGFVEGNGDTSATASAIAAAITAYTSNPEYTATAVGSQVTITAATPGAAANGRAITVNKGAALTFNPATPPVMNNGADARIGTFQPGTFVRTIGSKEYSLSGPNMHFSGIKAPTKWTTDATGAGFIDMSSEASGAEELSAVAKYLNQIAVFARRSIQVWYVDPDPTLNKQAQVLNNTGTRCPRSVTQFGDSDLFYADASGIRSLRARATTNAASTSDVGVAIDTLVASKLATLSADELRNVIGVIEPRDGRFWLAVKDVIYVFSFFADGKISAWSIYSPGFVVQDMVPFEDRVYLRSGNTIYVYGGLDTELTYDATEAEVWLPYLDAGKPAQMKSWRGIDAAVRGEWEIHVGMDPTNHDASDKVATVFRTTYNGQQIPLIGQSSHISVRMMSKGDGPAVIGSLALHFQGGLED